MTLRHVVWSDGHGNTLLGSSKQILEGGGGRRGGGGGIRQNCAVIWNFSEHQRCLLQDRDKQLKYIAIASGWAILQLERRIPEGPDADACAVHVRVECSKPDLQSVCVGQAACCDAERPACTCESATALVLGHSGRVAQAGYAHRHSSQLQSCVRLQNVPCVL